MNRKKILAFALSADCPARYGKPAVVTHLCQMHLSAVD